SIITLSLHDALPISFQYIVPLANIFLTRLFSKRRLKRKEFQEIVRLTWAQEAPGSNPGAPTKTSCLFSLACQNVATPSASLWNRSEEHTSELQSRFD